MDFNQACPSQGEFHHKPAFPPQDESYPQHGLPYPHQEQPYPQEGEPYPQQGQPYPQEGQPYLPPSYDSQPQPSTSANTTIVVTSQPATLTTASMSPPKNQQSVAICALVFSIITLICCGPYLIFLTCSIPALILAIMAIMSTGTKQKNNAGISITLNVVVIVCSVVSIIALFLATFIPVFLAFSKASFPSINHSSF